MVSTALDAPLLRALRREPAPHTPVWFMRQAGRYLPEYRAVRASRSLLEICAEPAVAAEVTLQPVRRLGVDAAIIFADILLPLVPLGLGLTFAPGEGPVIERPIRTADDVARLPAVDVHESLGTTLEALRLVRAELPVSVPLVGFAGAPFTVAAYAIEGGGSRDYRRTKAFMLSEPRAWHSLMSRLVEVLGDFLVAQHAAGAQVLQLFDSWVGMLCPATYRDFVLPHSRAILDRLAQLDVPVIHFGVGASTLIEELRRAGGDAIGLDWRIPIDEGWERIGFDRAVQGNLDPTVLFAPPAQVERRVRDILARVDGRPGHVFNVGHGILPETPVDAVRRVVDLVHEATAA